MPGGSRSERRRRLSVAAMWRRLGPEQRVAAVASLLLIVSTFGPFSFVEAAEVLTAVAVLALLRARAGGRQFHLPFGDGTVIAAAGAWSALLILIRLFDRPLGQNLLALVCTVLLLGAGVRERAKRGPDDLPVTRAGGDAGPRDWSAPTEPLGWEEPRRGETGTEPRRGSRRAPGERAKQPLDTPPEWEGDPPTERLG
ncbi:MAG: hypothetical protein ACJ76V_00895 [Thermoleophilaceae bacterium]